MSYSPFRVREPPSPLASIVVEGPPIVMLSSEPLVVIELPPPPSSTVVDAPVDVTVVPEQRWLRLSEQHSVLR